MAATMKSKACRVCGSHRSVKAGRCVRCRPKNGRFQVRRQDLSKENDRTVARFDKRQDADREAARLNQEVVAEHGKWALAPLYYVEDSVLI